MLLIKQLLSTYGIQALLERRLRHNFLCAEIFIQQKKELIKIKKEMIWVNVRTQWFHLGLLDVKGSFTKNVKIIIDGCSATKLHQTFYYLTFRHLTCLLLVKLEAETSFLLISPLLSSPHPYKKRTFMLKCFWWCVLSTLFC